VAFKFHGVEGRHVALQVGAPLGALVGDGVLGEALEVGFPVLAVALVLVVARVLEAFVALLGLVVPGRERVGRGSGCACEVGRGGMGG